MEIHQSGGIPGPDPIQPKRISQSRFTPPKGPSHGVDRAEISDHAKFLAKLREVPPIRKEKVEELRALIASLRYETPERIAGAVEKLLRELDE